jgi:hypothetical protein
MSLKKKFMFKKNKNSKEDKLTIRSGKKEPQINKGINKLAIKTHI